LANTELDQILISEKVVGHLHGHNHTIEAYHDSVSGRLVFSSGSGVNTEAQDDYGVMYFDVYKDAMSFFWKSVKGQIKPMGTFNLKGTALTV
jgi:hypothetical protein